MSNGRDGHSNRGTGHLSQVNRICSPVQLVLLPVLSFPLSVICQGTTWHFALVQSFVSQMVSVLWGFFSRALGVGVNLMAWTGRWDAKDQGDGRGFVQERLLEGIGEEVVC